MDVSKANPVGQIVYWTTTESGLAEAEMSAKSVREVQGPATLYLYTTREAPAQLWADHVVRMDFHRYPLMVANLVAQAHFTLKYLDLPTAFLDTDVLLTRRLDVPPAVDLAVTLRRHVAVSEQGEELGQDVAKAMPYNYGVILANPTLGAIEAILWLRDRVRKLTPEYQGWYGNQVALRELLGFEPDRHPPYVVKRSMPWADILVSILDAAVYNYSPEHPDEDLVNRRVLHLKGDRKKMMPRYLERILEEC